jgi:hypothetical protein
MWHRALPIIASVCRHFARDQSGMSPFRILFGREPNRFLDFIWGDPAVINPDDDPAST